MILNSQLLSKFVLVRENSRLVNSHRPETPKLPIPPILPQIGLFSGILLADALLLCVLCELCGCNSIMQNKANFKMGNINISTATTKCYLNEQRTMNNERYSKQTQSNPISPSPKPTQPRVHPVIPTEAPQGRSGGIYFNTVTTSETPYLAQFTKKSWAVLCKTKPISITTKPTQIIIPQVFTPIFRLSRFEKNKPNQTQTKPILPPRSAIRPTWRRAVIRCIMIPVGLS